MEQRYEQNGKGYYWAFPKADNNYSVKVAHLYFTVKDIIPSKPGSKLCTMHVKNWGPQLSSLSI